jgi:hypothetical protein
LHASKVALDRRDLLGKQLFVDEELRESHSIVVIGGAAIAMFYANRYVDRRPRLDLALMKIARGEREDIDALDLMHRARHFELPTLIERYREMLLVYVGDTRYMRRSFLLAVVKTLRRGRRDRAGAAARLALAGRPPAPVRRTQHERL